MKFGLAFASSIGTEGSSALQICTVAEKVGFESVWGGEHVIFPSKIESKYPYTADGKVPATKDTMIHDPLIWLAYVAAVAPSLRLGTCILILPQRNPLVLAKEISISEINQAGFYLNYQLMGILRSYHSNISVGAELKDSLRDMELLYIKGHYVQCQKLLEKAKKKATKYWNRER